MNIDHWAMPITDLGGKLLGVEIKSHVHREGVRHLAGMEREVVAEQLRVIESKRGWFLDNALFCMTTSEEATHHDLAFMRYMTTKKQEHEHQWLDDLGVHDGTAIPLVTSEYRAVRLNKRYVEENISRPIFPVLIKSIRQYCDKVIIPVLDKSNYRMLREAGVWAVQGEYKPIRFEQCEKLL